MNELPDMFARPWNITLRIEAWRLELRHHRDAIPSVPCNLLHFHSRLEDVMDADTRPALGASRINELRGFIGDRTWTEYENKAGGAPRDASERPALGYLSGSGETALWWRVGCIDDAEFEKYVKTLERVPIPPASLHVFMYGHRAMTFEGDRGETFAKAPIMSCSLKVGMGDFPELRV